MNSDSSTTNSNNETIFRWVVHTMHNIKLKDPIDEYRNEMSAKSALSIPKADERIPEGYRTFSTGGTVWSRDWNNYAHCEKPFRVVTSRARNDFELRSLRVLSAPLGEEHSQWSPRSKMSSQCELGTSGRRIVIVYRGSTLTLRIASSRLTRSHRLLAASRSAPRCANICIVPD